MTYATFTGTPEQVQYQVDRYFENFHPAGYNTRIESDATTDGVRTVVISRWDNCD